MLFRGSKTLHSQKKRSTFTTVSLMCCITGLDLHYGGAGIYRSGCLKVPPPKKMEAWFWRVLLETRWVFQNFGCLFGRKSLNKLLCCVCDSSHRHERQTVNGVQFRWQCTRLSGMTTGEPNQSHSISSPDPGGAMLVVGLDESGDVKKKLE